MAPRSSADPLEARTVADWHSVVAPPSAARIGRTGPSWAHQCEQNF